jgi:hypothetical protein
MPRRSDGARQVQVPGADVIARVLEAEILDIAMAPGANDMCGPLS